MGNICGCLLTHDDGQTLGSPSTAPRRNDDAPASQRPENARNAAAVAAEERQKAEQARGVNKANPNHGRLAAKLQASKSGISTEPEQPQRVVWD